MAEVMSVIVNREDCPACDPVEIYIENFGPIEAATIKLSPLVILIGKNNTGKSYAASMIWAARSLTALLQGRGGMPRLKAPKWFSDFIKEASHAKDGTLKIEGKKVAAHLNRYLARNKNKLVQNLMSLPEISIGRLRFEISSEMYVSYQKKLPKNFNFSENFQDNTSWRLSWNEAAPKRPQLHSALLTTSPNTEDDLFLYCVGNLINHRQGNFGSDAAYVPAARTGLMLSLGYIAESLLGSLAINNTEMDRGRFSLPTISFLRSLVSKRHSGEIKSDIADFLEKNILGGKIIQDDNSETSFLYQPVQSSERLPMHAVSSMVSEISPILSIMRRRGLSNGIILEEPEAHLHLSAQRFMARAIAKIVNGNNPVAITTHSDTFLQQLNLLFRLNGYPKTAAISKLGYGKDEILKISQASAYEFVKDGDRTIVKECLATTSGFIIESLNEALLGIADEAIYLSENDDRS